MKQSYENIPIICEMSMESVIVSLPKQRKVAWENRQKSSMAVY